MPWTPTRTRLQCVRNADSCFSKADCPKQQQPTRIVRGAQASLGVGHGPPLVNFYCGGSRVGCSRPGPAARVPEKNKHSMLRPAKTDAETIVSSHIGRV